MVLTVAVDASSAVTGGGATYVNDLLPRLAERADVRLGAILARRETEVKIPCDLRDRIVFCRSRWGALLPRWSRAVKDSGANVVYAPTEFSLRPYKVPLVLALRDVTLHRALVVPGARTHFVSAARRWAARVSARYSTSYIAVSQFVSQVGGAAIGLEAGRIHVVYHGVDSPPRQERKRDGTGLTRLVFVSNLGPHKGFHELVEALAHVTASWTLSVAGGFPGSDAERRTRELIERLGLSDRVTFRGYLARAELYELYSRSDVLVWPSRAESFGFPLVEAAKAGLLVVAADTPSAKEIVGQAARFYELGNADALTKVLEQVMHDDLRPGPLPREYTWDDCVDGTLSVLGEAAASGAAEWRK